RMRPGSTSGSTSAVRGTRRRFSRSCTATLAKARAGSSAKSFSPWVPTRSTASSARLRARRATSPASRPGGRASSSARSLAERGSPPSPTRGCSSTRIPPTCGPRCNRARRLPARRLAAVGLGDDLEQVAARVPEVDAASAVVAVDLAFLLSPRIGPVLHPALLQAAEDLVELRVAHEKRVVLGLDFHAVGVEERERYLVLHLDVEKRTERARLAQAEDLGEEAGGAVRVFRVHDGVVELDRHANEILSWKFGCSTSPRFRAPWEYPPRSRSRRRRRGSRPSAWSPCLRPSPRRSSPPSAACLPRDRSPRPAGRSSLSDGPCGCASRSRRRGAAGCGAYAVAGP